MVTTLHIAPNGMELVCDDTVYEGCITGLISCEMVLTGLGRVFGVIGDRRGEDEGTLFISIQTY